MSRKAWLGCALVPVLCLSRSAAAQQSTPPPDDPDVAELIELLNTRVISASKSEQSLSNVPAKIVVLTAEEIRLRGYVGFDEIFHDLAGMDVSQGRGVEWTTVFMRGIRTENTDRFLLIWDGVIQNDIWKYNVWISRQYPLTNIDRIEVMYGPSSLLYGANAFAGIINVILKKPKDVDGVSVQLLGGAYDTRLVEMNFGKEIGDFRFMANARWFTSDEFDVNGSSWTDAGGRQRYYNFVLARDGQRDASDPSGYAPGLKVRDGVPRWSFDGRDVAFDGRASGGTKDWFAQAGLGYKGFELKAFAWYRQEIEDNWYVPLRRMHGVWTPTGSAVDLSHQAALRRGITLKSYVKMTTSGLDPDHSYESGFTRTINDDRDDPNNLKVSSLGTITYYKLFNREWRTGQQVNLSAKNLEAVAGWEYTAAKSYEDYNTRTLTSDPWRYTPQHDERNVAVFLNAQAEVAPSFSLAAGLRYDYDYLAGESGGFGHLYTGRLAGIYSFHSHHRVKLIYGQAFQAPSPWHKFATIPGERDLPNPYLKPERLNSTELVYEFTEVPHWRNSLSVYFNQASDLIAAVAVPYNGGTTLQHQNTGGLEIFGQELESRYFFDAKSSVYLNATLSRTRVKETGRNQGDLAPFKANFGADLLLRNRWGVSVRAHFVSRRDTINQDSTDLFIAKGVASYFTVDAVLQWQGIVRGLDARVAVYNVFDKEYFDPGLRSADGRTYNPVIVQPGARAYAGLSYRY